MAIAFGQRVRSFFCTLKTEQRDELMKSKATEGAVERLQAKSVTFNFNIKGKIQFQKILCEACIILRTASNMD